ncbi:hypothetical protein PMIN01_06735 [Paraphaeosphaeria minitans]|uniref:Uncharacterized protein n=1 Tax=Paraphaeosphaeria minitans TaxID=565426 RepID=A0A9P6GHX5_9PLEO|nr:hypothetical protein PMIN01_06735 [Paraphaeosphaeria minitans]
MAVVAVMDAFRVRMGGTGERRRYSVAGCGPWVVLVLGGAGAGWCWCRGAGAGVLARCGGSAQPLCDGMGGGGRVEGAALWARQQVLQASSATMRLKRRQRSVRRAHERQSQRGSLCVTDSLTRVLRELAWQHDHEPMARPLAKRAFTQFLSQLLSCLMSLARMIRTTLPTIIAGVGVGVGVGVCFAAVGRSSLRGRLRLLSLSAPERQERSTLGLVADEMLCRAASDGAVLLYLNHPCIPRCIAIDTTT